MSVDEVTSPPQVVPRDNEEKQFDSKAQGRDGKQVAGADGKEKQEDWAYGLPNSDARTPFLDRIELHRSTRRGKVFWAGIAVALLVVGFALGVGLGVGLRSDRHGASSSNQDSAFLSTRGAFNGTGLLLKLEDDYGPGDQNALTLYYQHFSGEIRRMNFAGADMSSLPTPEQSVANDAKNGTPISVLATVSNEQHYQHVFYVSTDNEIKERIFNNVTAVWSHGTLNAQKITTIRSNKIGLHSASYDGPILNLDTKPTRHASGGRVWISTSETSFDQWAWRPGFQEWKWEQSWQGKNAHVSPAANDRTRGETTYVMFVDEQNKPELWWEDVANNIVSTNNHPINKWKKGQYLLCSPDFRPFEGRECKTTGTTGFFCTDALTADINLPTAESTTSLFRAGLWYAQNADSGNLLGWNISLVAENSTLLPSLFPTLDASLCMTNSNVDAAAIPAKGTPDTIYVVCQTRGDDITVYTSTPNSDSWSKAVVLIPNE